ncbi:hypothetical protein CEXT_346951 [Caerostris extrusa]|uniref:Uncharacterized protein n=1 Tax=Caerostris extrusa TaxID=172846 RepID=A0AAV4V7F7_CAEEX|nr:hypothetical protein CEXT_346951 [Caerostris extrusa]
MTFNTGVKIWEETSTSLCSANRSCRSFCNSTCISQTADLPFFFYCKTDLIWRRSKVQDLEIGFRSDVCNGSDSLRINEFTIVGSLLVMQSLFSKLCNLNQFISLLTTRNLFQKPYHSEILWFPDHPLKPKSILSLFALQMKNSLSNRNPFKIPKSNYLAKPNVPLEKPAKWTLIDANQPNY